MADTYRGLTIRIGGDATSLQKALRSVNGSISATEQQLRKMKKALEMDPENMGAMVTNLRLLGQRAVEAQQKLAQMRASVVELSKQKVELLGGAKSVKTLRELSDATRDANARAAEAKRNYAEVVEQLARVKSEIKRLTGIDLDKELNPDETVEAMRQLGMISDDVADSYARLRSSYESAFNENEIAKAVQGFDNLRSDIVSTDAEAQSLARRFSELSRAWRDVDFGDGLDDHLKRVDRAAEDVNDELRRLDSALGLDDGNIDAIAMKLRDMQEASTLADRKLELLGEKLSRMDDAGIGRISESTQDAALAAQKAADGYDEATAAVTKLRGELAELESRQSMLDAKGAVGTDEYRELGDRIQGARQQLERLVDAQREAKATVDTANQVQEYRELQTQIVETRSQQNKLNDEMREMSRFSGITQGSLVSLGMSMSTSVTPAMVALGRGMVTSSRDIDAAYRDMRKTVNGTEEDFENLRQAAIDFSATNVTSADQILSIQAIGGELGVATDDLEIFAETVSNLDVASNLGAEEAATALGQLDNILTDLDGSTMPNFADALVRLGNNGASTESQIADIASRIGAMGSIIGMSTPDILAWASTIASTGQGTEAAGTAISNTMRDIETAVAKGGEDLEGFAKVAGMSAEDFARSWNETPTDALHAFIDGLNNIEDSGGSALKTLQDLDINAARQTQTIQGLMQMIGGLDDNLAMSRDAWNGVSDEWGEAGDAAREAERKAEGFSGSLSRLQNMAQNLGSVFGEALVPMIDGVSDVLGTLYDWFVDLPDGAKQTVVAVGGIVAAFGPLMLLGKGVGELFDGVKDGIKNISNVSKAKRGLGDLADAASDATTSFGGMGTTLKGLLVGGGIALAIGGITALITEMQKAKEHAELVEKATKGLSDACRIAGSDASDGAEGIETMAEALADNDAALEDTLQRNADLADSFEELNKKTMASTKELDVAKGVIASYAGKTDLTKAQLADLETAIETLNSACGTNFDIVKDADGSYQIYEDGVRKTKEEIYKLIEAQKQQIRFDAQKQKLSDLYEAQVEDLDNYTGALADQETAQKDYSSALSDVRREFKKLGKDYDQYIADMSSGDLSRINPWNDFLSGQYQNNDLLDAMGDLNQSADDLDHASKQVKEFGDEYDKTCQRIDDVNASIRDGQIMADQSVESFGDLAKVLNGAAGTFGADELGMEEFVSALEDSGHSLDQWKNMSESDLIAVASYWKKTGGDVNAIMTQLGIDITGNAASVRNALLAMNDGEVAAALEGAGVDIGNFSLAMANAGITSETLNEIGSASFSALAANCGGSIDTLIWMIQNYNATNLGSKTADLEANPAPLIDAQNRIYLWNGSVLKTQTGQTVVDASSLKLANDEVLEWNSEGLPTINGTAMAKYDQVELANGEFLTWNGTYLEDQQGNVYVDEVQLTDCLGNQAEWNDNRLKPISGTVYCNYDELTAALGSIQSLKAQNGYTATVHLNTVKTTTNRVVTENVSSGSKPKSAPASLAPMSLTRVVVPSPAVSAQVPVVSSGPLSTMSRSGAASVARALSDDPGSYARAVTDEVRDAVVASRTVVVNGGGDSNSDVIRAIERLERKLPSIISESAPEAMPRDFIRGVKKAVRMDA